MIYSPAYNRSRLPSPTVPRKDVDLSGNVNKQEAIYKRADSGFLIFHPLETIDRR